MERQKRVIFVACGRKEEELWKRYLPLLTQLPELKMAGYQLSCWPEETHSGKGKRLKDWLSPIVRRVGRLRRFLEAPPFLAKDKNIDPDLTLVGMGTGCSLIQAYVIGCLSEDETVRSVRRIRQIIFIRPAVVLRYRILIGIVVLLTIAGALLQMLSSHSSSWMMNHSVAMLGLLGGMITLFFGIISNPAAMELLGLPPIQIHRDDLERQFKARVLEGNKSKPGTWPVSLQIPFLQDLGEDESIDVAKIAQSILHPLGHQHVYEVDLLERAVTITPEVKPWPDDLDLDQVDNTTLFVDSISFARRNTTSEGSPIPPWELRYQSYSGKILINDVSDANRWTPQEVSAYKYTHSQFVFRFFPKASQTYFLKGTVWNGFSRGNRDSHSHLRADTYYRRVVNTLDLSAYLEAGWRISRSPEAYFFFGEIPDAKGVERNLSGPSCDCIKSGREMEAGIALNATVLAPGCFSWELTEVRDGGVFGFCFDVEPE